MADATLSANADVLRRRVSRFLTRKSRLRTPLTTALRRLSEKKLPAVIFGGALRDLMVHGAASEPRDVDVVVDGASVEELAVLFSDVLIRRTRFGGLHLNVKGWMVDIWPLSDTWGLRELRIGARDFESLTQTTFLNVEAVIVDLAPFRNRVRRVYASGFFEALRTRTLDVNLEENPFPELSAIRSLVTASKLKFHLSRRLAKYVVYQTAKTPFEHFVDIQLRHYGFARFDVERIHRWSKIIQDQVGTQSVVRVPTHEPIQMSLPFSPVDSPPGSRALPRRNATFIPSLVTSNLALHSPNPPIMTAEALRHRDS